MLDRDSLCYFQTQVHLMQRYFSLLLCLLGAIGVFTLGCGGGGTSSKPAEAKRMIGVSLLSAKNPFFKIIGDAIAKEAQANGYSANVQYADEKLDVQETQVRNFINEKVSAIVLSPCRVEGIGPVIKLANDAKIPVFTVDTPYRGTEAKVVYQVATDNVEGGRQAALGMIEALGEAGGKIVILHYYQVESCVLRVQGFREVIDQHNASDKAKVEIVKEYDGGAAKEPGSKAAQDAITANPDIRGIFCINDPSALGAVFAVEAAKKQDQIKIIGFDGQLEARQAVKDGKIYAHPIQYPDQMGIEVVRGIVKHYQGAELKAEYLLPPHLFRKVDAAKDPELNN
jgi:ribose transport system substrate-binding protein